MTSSATLVFNADGTARGLYTDLIPLAEIGQLAIERASTIEFNHASQQWEVRSPGGELLFANASRQLCLDWEHANLSL